MLTMFCLSDMTLQSVLHVPNIKCNLISVNKLMKGFYCVVTFFSSHCEFQDLTSGRMICSAEERHGLYYLSDVDSPLGSRSLKRFHYLLISILISCSGSNFLGILVLHF